MDDTLSPVNKKKSPSEELWIVARTVAHGEFTLREYFAKLQIPCFVPTQRKLVKRKNGMQEGEVPLVSNLIFFRSDLTRAHVLFRLNSSRLFRVRSTEGLLTVPVREMERFIAFITEHYNQIVPLDDEVEYAEGDLMMIKAGPFAGLEGTITKINNRNHLILNLHGIFKVAVKYPKAELIKVKGRTDARKNK